MILPPKYNFGSILGQALGQGLGQGMSQGRDQSIVQGVLDQMGQTDPSKFAGIIGNAEAQLSNNPQAISALQKATDTYKGLREDKIAQELMDSQGFNELSYEDKVKKAVKAGIPMTKAVAIVGDLQRGRIEQQKILSPIQRIREDYKLDISILQQQLKNPNLAPEDREDLHKQIDKRRKLLDRAVKRYNQLKSIDPKTAEQMVNEIGYNDLGTDDAGAWNEILDQYTASEDQGQPRNQQQPDEQESDQKGGVESGQAGAPQSKTPKNESESDESEESALNFENVAASLAAIGVGAKALRSKKGVAAMKHLVKTLKSFNPKFNQVKPYAKKPPLTTAQRVKSDSTALRAAQERASRSAKANKIAASQLKNQPTKTPQPVAGRATSRSVGGSRVGRAGGLSGGFSGAGGIPGAAPIWIE